jgi:hypothetical protein
MAPRQAWVDGRVDVLLAALHDLGMSASRAAAAELIHERVRWVSAQAGISPTAARRYLTDDALTDLARTMVVTLAEETPGADVIASARTAAVPLPVLARCIAGLAEAIQLRLRERDDIDHLRTTVAELAQTLSAIGQVTADQRPGPAGPAPVVVMMPPGLVHRAARYLESPRPSSTGVRCPRTSAPPMRAGSRPPFGRTPRACATTPTNGPAGDHDASPDPEVRNPGSGRPRRRGLP